MAYLGHKCNRKCSTPCQWSLVDREKEATVNIDSNKTHVAHFLYIFCRCKCGKNKTNSLVGSFEHDICTEVLEAGGKSAFESRKDIRCRHQQECCSAVRNTVVLQITAPLLKEKMDFPIGLTNCLFSFRSLSLIYFEAYPAQY